MKRSERNPIITRRDLPDIGPNFRDVSAVFNPGAVPFGDKVLLLLRVQSRGRETILLKAESRDGLDFEIAREAIHMRGIEEIKETIYHVYDPRITRLDDTFYIMVAMDMDDGCRLGMACTDDFDTVDFMGIVAEDDVRNGVLFPERVAGRYLRLERPNLMQSEGGATSGDTICLAESTDLLRWRRIGPVMTGRWHYWDERIGSGPPPVKTREGWLHIYHGIATHFLSSNIYQAGVVLLDLDDPSQVIARGRNNILEPREPYELCGQVPNVVFPSGMVVEECDHEGFATAQSRVKIYYGAADTTVCLATTTIGELLASCEA
jgi:beta-1,4-mannooligosaccharide/beta-1,4-mannosyl-N-acetylglucosamine phosphorylase